MAAEMQSFLWKFLQLTHGGFDASLDVKSVDGIVHVSLGVGLGNIEPLIPPQPQTTSRTRRRLRRKRHKNFNESQDADAKVKSSQIDFPPETNQIDITALTEPITTSTETNLSESTFSTLSGLEYNEELDSNTFNDTAVQTVINSVNAECQTSDNLQSSKKMPVLSITKTLPVSIPPRTKIYHPAVINACKAVYKKHPCELTKEESSSMKSYLDRKRELGEPVEHDPTYLPISMRNCMHCGHLT